jgi:rod shape determining protein RodA
MSNSRERELVGSKSVDYVLVSLYLSLIGIGWLMIYAVGYAKGYSTLDATEFFTKTPVGKQSIFIIISTFLTFFILTIDWKFWRIGAYLVYGFGLVLLVLVLFIGVKVNGARAWFGFGGFGFQPAEVAKLGTCLALSSYLASPSVSLRDMRSQLTIGGILLAPVFLILLQPDAGSCMVFLSFSILLFREGLSPIPFIIGFALSAVFIFALKFEPNLVVLCLMMLALVIFVFNVNATRPIWIAGLFVICAVAFYAYYTKHIEAALITSLAAVLLMLIVHSRRGRFRTVVLTGGGLFVAISLVYGANFLYNHLQPHQQERLKVWLRPDECDPRGAAYNLIHSKMAIGSGGLQGKGFLEGTMTKLNYVPEQSTDFIFCTIGEEQGFIGTFGVIAIFIMFLVRIIQIAERQKSNFSRHYAYGVAGIFFVHIFINISMTMGLLPVVGIPLPFISAGGSSLLGFTTMMAILLKLDSHRYSV